MIPFARDLISTLVVGSIFPVATTDLTIVPASAVTTFGGIDVRRGALQPDEAGDRANEDHGEHEADVKTFAGGFCRWHTVLILTSPQRVKFKFGPRG